MLRNNNKSSRSFGGQRVAKKEGTKRRGLKDITNRFGVRSGKSDGFKMGGAKKSTALRPAIATKKGVKEATSKLGFMHLGDKVKDIDAKDRDDPQAVTEYINDIMSYFRVIEGVNGPSPSYMSKQPHINAKMRAILVDWLVEVHLKFKLMPETLYLQQRVLSPRVELAYLCCEASAKSGGVRELLQCQVLPGPGRQKALWQLGAFQVRPSAVLLLSRSPLSHF